MHTKTLRELAEMMLFGAGGPKDMEHALWLKWTAYRRNNDEETLEELVDLLKSYAESGLHPDLQRRAESAALNVEEAREELRYVDGFLRRLVHEKLGPGQQT